MTTTAASVSPATAGAAPNGGQELAMPRSTLVRTHSLAESSMTRATNTSDSSTSYSPDLNRTITPCSDGSATSRAASRSEQPAAPYVEGCTTNESAQLLPFPRPMFLDSPALPHVVACALNLMQRRDSPTKHISVVQNSKAPCSAEVRDKCSFEFCACAAPGISVVDYVSRLYTFFRCSPEALVSALVLVDRFCGRVGQGITELNVHRLMSTALCEAAKVYDDVYLSNAFYGQAAGICAEEMNHLELSFLIALDFDVNITAFEWGCWCQILRNIYMSEACFQGAK